MVYSISGFFKDDLLEFSNYLVTDYDNTPTGYNDEDIFFYGLKLDNNYIDDEGLDFIITRFRVLE